MKGNRKIHLTGLLGNSAMGISDSKITIHDDELNIVLFEALAKGKYSGDLNKEIIIKNLLRKLLLVLIIKLYGKIKVRFLTFALMEW